MKKILSLILAGLMTVSCAAFVAADDAAVEATSDPAQEAAIEFLAEYGIFKGYDAENTGAEDDILRYQMALFVARISTGWVDDATWEDGTANDSKFTDLEGDVAKYLGAISYANQNGIIEGYSATKFAPNDNITYRDALTMVVRTLGYKGLSYPWGNIEKAVELGLTEGVDAAYTDVLTRGEVALIIYNALFADTAKGETLAKSIFDVDFAWQNIIVVASDEYSMIENADGKQYAPAGYVGFKTIKADASIGDKVWFVKAEELGLSGHQDEQAVGSVYVALFEAVDGNYVTIKKADSGLIKKTVKNIGVTDNAGLEVTTQPIAAELAKYQLVKNYKDNKVSYEYEDLMVLGYETVTVWDNDKEVDLVGIDYKTNNIMFYYGACDKTEHTDHKCGWEVEWFYNKELNAYYQYVVDSTNTKKDVTAAVDGQVYINWMSESDFTKWYNEIIKKEVGSYLTLKEQENFAKDGKYAYAKLDLYDLDDNVYTDGELAIYKEYAIGKFSTSSMVCGVNAGGVDHKNDTKHTSYKITSLVDGSTVFERIVDGHTAAHEAIDAQYAWLTVDPSVTTFDPAVGGVVLYDYNANSGEIEIVKHITTGENDDADSKIITGILQAYSTSRKTVTISGKTYPYGYDNLNGDVYEQANNDYANRILHANEFDKQYMQYVSAVICDGIVVDTDLVGEETDFIVVLGYAGITNDGYIAVYGYKTSDPTLSVFKIDSFNGWKKGDYRYNPENAEDDKAFDFGSLYQIRSLNEDGAYGVYTQTVSSVLEGAKPVQITFRDGYRVITDAKVKYENNDYVLYTEKDAASTVTKVDAADKYVIVTNASEDDDNITDLLTSNIFVKTGKITSANYNISGLLVKSTNNNSFVLYTDCDLDNATRNSYFLRNAHEVGYVLYEKGNGKVLESAYDEAIGDSYLLGETQSEVAVTDLLTGNQKAVIASSNIDLKNGHIYKTIANRILWDVTDKCDYDNLHSFIGAIDAAYSLDNKSDAEYIVMSELKLTKAQIMSDVAVANALKLATRKLESADKVDVDIADKLVHNDRLVYLVEEGDYGWYTQDHHGITEISALTLADNATYTVAIIYNVATTKTVMYVFGEDAIVSDPVSESTTNKAKDGEFGTLEYQEPGKDAKTTIGLYGEYTVKATYDDAECKEQPTKLELTAVKTYFGTKAADGTIAALVSGECALHNMLAADDQGFGVDYTDDDSNYRVQIKVGNNVQTLTKKEYTITGLTCCDLGYMAEIKLAKGIELDLTAANTVEIKVIDSKNNTLYTVADLTAEYIPSALTEGQVYNGFVVDNMNATTTGEIDLNRVDEDGNSIYEDTKDSIIILG